MNTNLRFDPIRHPLSDLFVVFDEQRFTAAGGTPPGRGFIVELTYMVAF